MRGSIVLAAIMAWAATGSAAEETKSGSGLLPDRAFVATGWQDYGRCNDEDSWNCTNKGGFGCQRPEERCASGYASVVAVEPGDNKCVINWFRWECRAKGDAPVAPPPADSAETLKWRAEMRRRNEVRLERYERMRRSYEDYLSELRQTNSCVIDAAAIDPDTTVVVASAYRAFGALRREPWVEDSKHGSLIVDVAPEILNGPEKIVLFLTSYDPVEWIVTPTLAKNLAGVSYHNAMIDGLSPGTPVALQSGAGRRKPNGDDPAGGAACTSLGDAASYMGTDLRGVERLLGTIGLGKISYARTLEGAGHVLTIDSASKIEAEPPSDLPMPDEPPAPHLRVVPGDAGVRQLLVAGAVREANSQDILIMEKNLLARARALSLNSPKPPPSLPAGKTFVVLTAITVPERLDNHAFLVPHGVPMPEIRSGTHYIYRVDGNSFQRHSVLTTDF